MLPVTAISMVFVMLIPVPSFVLDLLLAASITASVIVFLTAVQIRRAVDFSVFPTLLLLLTMFRLSLNLASSRRILLHGHEGTQAAGAVIEAFGQFVVGGNYVVGFVLFLALIAIQFLVVSHGAVRTAEVTARFTLDALPGKQMAIDADMNAGLIDEQGARKRRQAIAREAEFYGAMDGAAQVQPAGCAGDDSDYGDQYCGGAADRRVAAGCGSGDGGEDLHDPHGGRWTGDDDSEPAGFDRGRNGADACFFIGDVWMRSWETQLLAGRNTLWIACGVLLGLALIPGLPKLSFVLMAGGVALMARRLPAASRMRLRCWLRRLRRAGQKAKAAEAAKGENLASLLKMDELTLEIGFQLIPLVDEKQGGQMLNRVRALRRHLATELGFIVPPVHITDNLRLKPREYVVSLRGVEIARWQTEQNCLLAVNADPKARALPGIETREPAFGVAARWIQPGLEEAALAAGYSVVDQTTVIGTHLGELIRRHAHELLGRQEVKRLLDSMNESHPKLVEELVPKLMTLGEVQRVLQQLLREQVSIRDLGAILEVLVEAAQQSKNVVHLVESVRQSLGRGLVRPLLDGEGGLRVLMLEPGLEAELVNTFDPQSAALLLGDGARPAGLPADFLRRLVESVKRLTGGGSDHGTARASMPESGPLSRAAMAGAVFAEGDGAGAGGDSAGDHGSGASGRLGRADCAAVRDERRE